MYVNARDIRLYIYVYAYMYVNVSIICNIYAIFITWYDMYMY